MLAKLANFSLYFDGFDHVNHIFSECVSSRLIILTTLNPLTTVTTLSHQDHMDHLDNLDHLETLTTLTYLTSLTTYLELDRCKKVIRKNQFTKFAKNLSTTTICKRIIHNDNLQKNCAKE